MQALKFVASRPKLRALVANEPQRPSTSTARTGEPTVERLNARHAVLLTRQSSNRVEWALKRELELNASRRLKVEFTERFAEIAQDPTEFATLLRTSFGSQLDDAQIDALRFRTLRGDTSWLPKLEWLPDGDMNGGLGAYSSESDIIYLNQELLRDPDMALNVFSEEMGHALDARLNARDTLGDEGTLFRRLLSGETLSATEIEAVRKKDDHGVIFVDGRAVEVEFFLKKVGRWAVKGAKNVGRGIRSVARRMRATGKIVLSAVHNVVDKAIAKSVEGAKDLIKAPWDLVHGRFVKAGKRLFGGLFKLMFQMPAEALLYALGKAISAHQTLLGIEPVGRGLKPEEEAYLRTIFGDSIDYDKVIIKTGRAGLFVGKHPFVFGNTIYMRDQPFRMTRHDGQWLPRKGMEVLVHEMVHVWQFQNGTGSYASEALASQAAGHGYNWEGSIPETPWEKLEPEQQAEFIEAAVVSGALRNGGEFLWPPESETPHDYSDYLRYALEEIRHGRGAP